MTDLKNSTYDEPQSIADKMKAALPGIQATIGQSLKDVAEGAKRDWKQAVGSFALVGTLFGAGFLASEFQVKDYRAYDKDYKKLSYQLTDEVNAGVLADKGQLGIKARSAVIEVSNAANYGAVDEVTTDINGVIFTGAKIDSFALLAAVQSQAEKVHEIATKPTPANRLAMLVSFDPAAPGYYTLGRQEEALKYLVTQLQIPAGYTIQKNAP